VTVLVVIETIAIGLLAILVVGLLRSHAEILRLLHHLGVDYLEGGPADLGPAPRPVRRVGAIADVAGLAPNGDAVVVGTSHPEAHTLLLFLSSGCEKCEAFFEAIAARSPAGLGVRTLVVTRDADQESPGLLREWSARGVDIVLSSAAWEAFAVPGSPYAVLCSGGSVRGEGTAASWRQLESLVAQAELDRDSALARAGAVAGRPIHDTDRERRADAELLAAGIEPGDPRLWPSGDRGTP